MVTAVALLLLLNDKCKLESLQSDGRPGWRFPQTAGCKARTCFVGINISSYLIESFQNFLEEILTHNFLGIEVGLKLFFICKLEMVVRPL